MPHILHTHKKSLIIYYNNISKRANSMQIRWSKEEQRVCILNVWICLYAWVWQAIRLKCYIQRTRRLLLDSRSLLLASNLIFAGQAVSQSVLFLQEHVHLDARCFWPSPLLFFLFFATMLQHFSVHVERCVARWESLSVRLSNVCARQERTEFCLKS